MTPAERQFGIMFLASQLLLEFGKDGVVSGDPVQIVNFIVSLVEREGNRDQESDRCI